MLSRRLEKTLHKALDFANQRRHEYATLEHLLMALTEDQDAVAVFRACGVDLEQLKRDLLHYIETDLSNLVGARPEEAKPTAGFQRVVQRAVIHVQSSGRAEVTGANVLVALFSERESHAVFFLQEQKMSRFDAVNYISHGITKAAGAAERPERSDSRRRSEASAEEETTAERPTKRGHEALDNYCVNLNKKAT
ncbi:MAG: ATP-dependent Clp protease ATP-binding subunit ClpA, partial [Alphaproteobacteria bacterium]|nr:ATP-dependent Clp protease ATP-binding subunit ClpA [Alphaproteobacteria bacterium]